MNQKNNDTKKKKKDKSEFEFCKVCNRNHDEGSRHKYFPYHTKSLPSFLSRFQNKFNKIRFFLRNPSVLRAEHASCNRFWCVFCDCDIDELGSSFACENAINHLASGDHLKKLKHFLWKNGGGMDRVDAFRILEADVTKWEKKCKSLKSEAISCGEAEASQGPPAGTSNDIHKDLDFENINNFEKNSIHHLNSNISDGVMPLQYNTNEYQISHWELSGVANVGSNLHVIASSLPEETWKGTSLWNSDNLMVNRSALCGGMSGSGDFFLNENRMCQAYQGETVVSREINSQGLQSITQICSMALQETGGNVHAGAPPPWFEATERDQLKPVSNGLAASLNKSGKSKLNPKRVGAAWAEKRKMEMEMEKRGEIVKSDYDPNWLPNFGRVWQSGSRKESRKEYEVEKQKQPNIKSLSEMPMKIHPYVSKRMRIDGGKDSADPDLS